MVLVRNLGEMGDCRLDEFWLWFLGLLFSGKHKELGEILKRWTLNLTQPYKIGL